MAGDRVYLDYVPEKETDDSEDLGDDPEISQLFFGWFLEYGLACITEPSGLPCPLKADAEIRDLGITMRENKRYVKRLWKICASERLKAINEDREERANKRKSK